jgi:2-C-methyl-D-erythritol 2,4-cyclodiphosphate synthase
MRIGIGYDAHKLVEGRELILGGVKLEHPKGLLGHSDADVLLHAIIDALIGAVGQGSIGDFFPDTDPQYKGISSLELLKRVYQVIHGQGYLIKNIDSTVVLEEPRLQPHIQKMKENISQALDLDPSQVNVKGKTEEGMGFTGKKEGISALAVCLVHKQIIE